CSPRGPSTRVATASIASTRPMPPRKVRASRSMTPAISATGTTALTDPASALRPAPATSTPDGAGPAPSAVTGGVPGQGRVSGQARTATAVSNITAMLTQSPARVPRLVPSDVTTSDPCPPDKAPAPGCPG